jgi:hypothetical protein
MTRSAVARIWIGHVPADRADDYQLLMEEVALPDYRGTPGNLLAACLRSDRPAGLSECQMVTVWIDHDAIRAFAGPQIDKAVYYDFDEEFLVDRPHHVRHFLTRYSS